jgi:nucleotide-binding universal stress UspA family protein
MMFTRVLVPVDGTASSEKVIPYAIDLAKATNAEVILCHVITGPLAANASSQPRYAAQYVEDVALGFSSAGINVRTQIRRGDPAVEIRSTALDWEVDLIVMATRSRPRVTRLMLGSVADEVVRDSHLPVLLISTNKPAALKNAA